MGKKAAAVAKHAITLAAGLKSVKAAVEDYKGDVHQVVWLDDNDQLIDVTFVEHGKYPEHSIPVKPSVGNYDYIFDDWYPLREKVTRDTEYHARFVEVDRSKEGETVFQMYNHVTDENNRFVTYYTDDYFKTPATGYNPSLTTFALLMALSSGNRTDEPSHNADFAVDLMRNIGCDRIEVNDYFLAEKKRVDDIGVVVGIKEMDVPMVFVLVRGSYYGSEFGGNLIVGTGERTNGNHEGFSAAKDKAMTFIRSVLSKYSLEGRVRMMTTGYSRGGAVSNLIASEITDMIIDGRIEEELGVSMSRDDMYGFCFEPALCQYSKSHQEKKYANILCVIDPNDIVVKVPPKQFGFTVFGRVKWLDSNDKGKTEIMLRYMEKYFGKGISDYYIVPGYVPQKGIPTLGSMTDFILAKSVGTFGDRDRYVSVLQNDLAYTVYSIIDNLDEARKAFSSLDPTNKTFEDILPTLFSRESFTKRMEAKVERFNILTETDPKTMMAVVGQAYDLLKKFRPEDLLAVFLAVKGNFKRMVNPHYPLGPVSFLLAEDPNYNLDNYPVIDDDVKKLESP